MNPSTVHDWLLHVLALAQAILIFLQIRQLAKLQRERNRYRVALVECGRFGYWDKGTSQETLIEMLDHITDVSNEALEELVP